MSPDVITKMLTDLKKKTQFIFCKCFYFEINKTLKKSRTEKHNLCAWKTPIIMKSLKEFSPSRSFFLISSLFHLKEENPVSLAHRFFTVYYNLHV